MASTTTSSTALSETGNTAEPLDAIFSPKSVAVVGVNATPGTVPFDIFQSILLGGYKGTAYPVAPGKRSICSVKAYRYVVDIPDPVDLAVIVFPSDVVERALKQCAEKGIKAAIVISAGFREVGPEGVEREERLKAVCREYGISLIGPNCLGVINTDPKIRLNASFARRMPHAGRIGFLSQSGALCTAVLDYAFQKEIGFSKFISFGNKAGVTEIELLEYLQRDGRTDVILMYLEELRDGRRLIEAARRITRGSHAKPILAIKSGRTPQGAAAAVSHTGSLAGEDAVCDALFREAGIIRVRTLEELFNTAVLYVDQPLPAGNRLAIVTNAGGPGVMATDAAVDAGLEVPRLADDTMAKLAKSLPATANIKNPVDVIGDARADRYMAALEGVLADPDVDQAMVILTPQSMTDIEDIAQSICRIEKDATKPIACSFMGATDVAAGIRVLQKARVPHYSLPESGCRAMADIQEICNWRRWPADELQPPAVDSATVKSIVDEAEAGYLLEDQALDVLAAYGLPVPQYKLCGSAGEAVRFASELGYPVVLRVISRQIVHKSEMKAVALDLRDAAALESAYDRMLSHIGRQFPEAEISGVLVRPMIPAGHEIILGGRRDPAFGPVLMFGLGGILVEYFKDVTFAMAPIGPAAAGRMIRRVRTHPVLQGARGGEPADLDGIGQCLVRLGYLISDFERIAELDVNPLIAGPASTGNAVADVRIRLSG